MEMDWKRKDTTRNVIDLNRKEENENLEEIEEEWL